MKYDRLTTKVLKKLLKKDSNCIDIGAHKGEILKQMRFYAPIGFHYAFEPVPIFYNFLRHKFKKENITIYPDALSNYKGESTFKYVKNDPAYSGLKQRRYDIKNPIIEDISVSVNRLDEVIPENYKIDLIKIDVEGGEFNVLKGGERLIKLWKPTIVFESGTGASDYYNTDPNELYNFITKNLGLKLFTLGAFLDNKIDLDNLEFQFLYENNIEYYFVASA